MSTTANTVDSPIQSATGPGGNLFTSPTIHSIPLPSGTAGTFATLAAMAECVRGEVPPDFCGYSNPAIIKYAQWLVRNCSKSEEIRACFGLVAHHIKYLAHPTDQQIVQDACRTIQFKTGDCVSKSVLLATLLCALGYQCKFIAQYPGDDTGYSHVYILAIDESGNEVRLDPVASDKPMGWSQPLPDGGFETSFEIF